MKGWDDAGTLGYLVDAQDAEIQAIGAVAHEVEALRADVAALGAQSDAAGATVLIDAEQWDGLTASVADMQDRLGELSVCSIALICIVAAILGNRLWAAFAEGWR